MLKHRRRMLAFQKDSALVKWFRTRTSDGRPKTRKTMIVAPAMLCIACSWLKKSRPPAAARKLLIALWRMVTAGEIPQGFVLRPAAVQF
jgi:transposase